MGIFNQTVRLKEEGEGGKKKKKENRKATWVKELESQGGNFAYSYNIHEFDDEIQMKVFKDI